MSIISHSSIDQDKVDESLPTCVANFLNHPVFKEDENGQVYSKFMGRHL